jgi:type IV pilus assembly protein PilW
MIITAFKFQRGLSLVELMIAITLSIFIVAAMISLFINSKENYRLNENMSRLQENARFAVSFISRDVRMADYRACVTAERRDDAITGSNNTGLNGTDTVTVLWQSNVCGAALATVSAVYSIQAGAGGGPALFRSINGAAAQELVEGIEDLQILYGQDTDNDDVPNYFVDAATITDMAQAVSVRINLVARTLETNLAADGGRITRAFTSTVTLRNRLP